MAKIVGYIMLTVRFAREGDQWTAACEELGTATYGDSLEEVQEAISNLMQLHLDALDDAGEREDFLHSRNVRIYRKRPSDRKRQVDVRPDEFVGQQRMKLAIAAAH